MYQASSAFHEAVANGNDQMALLIFPDCVFSNGDINVEDGIEFRDYFSLEEDIAIGQTPSNEVIFSLFNDGGLLNDYAFGDFLATLGVVIREESILSRSSIYVRSGNNEYTTYTSSPYIRRNGTALSYPYHAPIECVMIYDGKVYCYVNGGNYIVYSDSNGSVLNVTINQFMLEKMKRLKYYGYCYNKSTRILDEYYGEKHRTFEFVPLGWFTAERPKAPDTVLIDMTCNDFMMKFEKDMPSDEELGLTWPCTIGQLFVKMCTYLGVSYQTGSFLNSSAEISARPEEFDTATMRDVLKWIAEAAGSIARFNRDGVLVMDWLRSTGQSITANGYKTFDPYWYKTKKITKLYNRASNGSYDKTKGTGNEGYLIQDNPLLKEVE